jgi:cyclase
MIKRISAVIVLDSDLVVNAYKFKWHLPVGDLRYTLERLQELRVDEVVILNSSHSNSPNVDFKKIYSDFDSWHISTPIAYGGGINSLSQAKEIIKGGADRVVLSAQILLNDRTLGEFGDLFGEQALILHLPVYLKNSQLQILNIDDLSLEAMIKNIPEHWGGEVMFSVVESDGAKNPNWDVLNSCRKFLGNTRKAIFSSGFSHPKDILRGLKIEGVQAIAIGNYLHRTEVSIPIIKNAIKYEVQTR